MENINEVKEPLKQKLLRLIKKSPGAIIGTIIGGAGGYLYYLFVGCSSGACAITSNPFMSVLWGALLGYLIGDTFKKNKKTSDHEPE
ncbi:MAG TPA: DUF6132 family protein [Bacteroidales bacterium]|nr:DUF6132 family protein [Bacteroidales bacterium]